MFKRIESDLHQAIVKDLKDRNIVDDLYLDGKLPFMNITRTVPSEENLDFDYSRLTLVSKGEHTDKENGTHMFQGMHWKMPYCIVKNGHSTFLNRPGGEIGGFVRNLIVEVVFDQMTGEPNVEIKEIEQDVYSHAR